MSKYEALPQFLASVGGAAHRMSFREIETVLGFKLPKSAYEHEAWWSNNATGHSHARAWLKFGWRTEAVDLAGRKVTFQRDGPIPLVGVVAKADPWGCMAGTVTFMPGTDLTAPAAKVERRGRPGLLNE